MAADNERAHALAEVERDYPGWHAWPGVLAGVVYARRPAAARPWSCGLPARPGYAARSRPLKQNGD